tara:strand:+ start:204 stop:767 length:564 start_codon:yes stop_codon:yes gene_type:complete
MSKDLEQLHENYKCSDHSVENTLSYLNSVKIVEEMNSTFEELKNKLEDRPWHPILEKSEAANTKDLSSSHLNKIFNFYGFYEVATFYSNNNKFEKKRLEHYIYGGQSGDSTHKAEGDVGTSCANRLGNHGDKLLGRGKISSSEKEWQKHWNGEGTVYCRAIRIDKRLARAFEAYMIEQRNPILNRQA